MNRRPLAQGTRVHVNAILIAEKFGNMRITTTPPGAFNAITVERADIDDLVTALQRHLAEGKSACVGSIMVAQAWGSLKISTTHTPANTILIARESIDDLTAALAEALNHRVGTP